MNQVLQFFALVSILAFSFVPFSAEAEVQAYIVQPGDLLSLRVMQWDPVEQTIENWEAISANYAVGMDGTVKIPFVGAVMAAGLPVSKIGAEIASVIQNKFALQSPPEATIDVVAFRQITVQGLVQRPGAFDFYPGSSARQAIGMAGGFAEELILGSSRAREYVIGQGALDLLRDRRERLLVQLARINAERANSPFPNTIPGLIRSSSTADLLAAEKTLMAVRTDSLTRGLAGIENQKSLLEAEIDALVAKQGALLRQVVLADEAMQSVTSLSERGLVASSRLQEAERSRAAVENQSLDVSVALLKARQALATSNSDRAALLDGREAELVMQGRDIVAEMAEIDRKMATQISVSGTLKPSYEIEVENGSLPQLQVVIYRRTQAGIEKLMDAADLMLMPGDIVDVILAGTVTN